MFLTELQRQRHPYAGLIPKKIWALDFEQQLTSSEVELMTSMPHLIQFNSMKWRKNTVYLCFLHAYPKIAPKEFFKRIEWTHESIHYALKAICKSNRLDLLKYMANYFPGEFQLHLEFNRFSLLLEAVRGYSFKIIKSLFSLYQGDVVDVLHASEYDVLMSCSRRPHFKTQLFDFLLSLKPYEFNEIPAKKRFTLFNSAILNGNIPLIHCILALWPQGAELLLRRFNFEAYVSAVKSGNIALLDYFFSLNYHSKEEVIRHNKYGLIHHAVKKGQLRIFNELIDCLNSSELEELILADEYELLYLAARNGHVRLFNQLFKLISRKENPKIEVRLASAFIGAAQKGSVSMMSRLMSCFPQYRETMNAAEDYSAFRKAAFHGHLSVLHFLSKQFPSKMHEMIRSDNFYAFRKAAFFGHHMVMEFLEQSYPRAVHWMIAAEDFDALVDACYSQDVRLVKWLATKVPGQPNRWVYAQEGRAFLNALAGANFPLIKYLLSLLGAEAKPFLLGLKPSTLVSNINDVRVLNYIVSVCPELKEPLILSPEYNLFANAIRYLQIDILEYIVQEYSQKLWDILITKKNRISLVLVMYNKDSSVVRLLTKAIPEFNKILCFCEMLADIALYSESPALFNYLIKFLSSQYRHALLLEQDCLVFRSAVKNGNLATIRLIEQMAPQPHHELIQRDTTLIQDAVTNKKLDVLEFLLSCCSAPETNTIFQKPKERGMKFINPLRRAQLDEAPFIFNSESLFLDPAQLTTKEKLNLVLSCIFMGYVFIAKTIAYQLFGNKYFYCKMLLELAQLKANSQELLPCIVDFLRTQIGVSEEQLRYYLGNQSMDAFSDRNVKRIAH